MFRVLIIALGLAFASGCSVIDMLVYKIDVPQGNFIDAKQVEKLRIGMTKEQVTYVLGTPLANNPFNTSEWHYAYRYKTGKGQRLKKDLIAYFDENERLSKVTGDYKLSDQFNVPIEQDLPEQPQTP